MTELKNIYPGKHFSVREEHFSQEEKDIINVLSKEFYVTNGGGVITLTSNSKYKYILLRPTDIYIEMFNLDREIIVLFSDYTNFQSRTLDAIEQAAKQLSSLRVDKTCCILISKDQDIEENISDLIKKEPETANIIPFTYNETQKGNSDGYFFRNRVQKYLYNRDLFSFEAPLKSDWLFFGRNEIILSTINRMKGGNNAGVFGLRKTGKTSLINAISRNLQKNGEVVTTIDCQSPSINKRKWNEAIYYVCKKTKEDNYLQSFLPEEVYFTEKDAAELLAKFVRDVNKEKDKKLFLIFDEIENISRVTSPTEHWRSGADFLYFWQSMRTVFQTVGINLAYLIVGTNPSCIETPRIDSSDNPLFNHFTPTYLPGFDIRSTRDMIRRIGKRMGVNFEEAIYTNINEEYGGHPFLIRQVCSIIARNSFSQTKPVSIGKISYKEAVKSFGENSFNYLEMIIGVLKEHYNEEYELLITLAHEDNETFKEASRRKQNSLAHLLGYGILGKDNGGYYFIIDSMRSYLLEINKYRKMETSIEQRWAEISERRNIAERKLRTIIKTTLKSMYGEELAKSAILDILGGKRKAEYTSKNFNDIFDPNLSTIFFEDIRKIISKEWGSFENIFEKSKKETFDSLGFINKYRSDAHAKDITPDEFALFRISMLKIEGDISQYFS
ncbi:TPA: ATP-binding protein [Klebsiella pneumoniae]|nr:ATP-binding protein [Klebsiella pneumoniae]HCM6607364.1 ATP-binding protein [Klebsiella pneumoniae]HCU1140697.1 ATP-binding protein [Klebsiella pneumoniae]